MTIFTSRLNARPTRAARSECPVARHRRICGHHRWNGHRRIVPDWTQDLALTEDFGLHLVSAWATQNTLTLGQVRTAEKSNEITAIPQLLDLLDLQGCIVTIDAMGCQREIADRLVATGSNFGADDWAWSIVGPDTPVYSYWTNFLDLSHILLSYGHHCAEDRQA